MTAPGVIYGSILVEQADGSTMIPEGADAQKGDVSVEGFGFATILPNGWYYMPTPAGSYDVVYNCTCLSYDHTKHVDLGPMEFKQVDVIIPYQP